MKEFRFALKQTFPIFFTYIFIGIAFGVLMADAGYSVLWSVLSAVFVYAGSLQILMVDLLREGEPLWTVAMMTFFVNARHLFYGVGLIERFRRMGKRYPYMVLTLTDETYSILCSVQYETGLDENKASFFISFLNHFYWMLGCLLGGCVGHLLHFDLTGIDFSATAFFLVVVIGQWEKCKSKLPAIVGLGSALLFYFLLGAENFLIPALSLSMIVLVCIRDGIEGGASHAE